MELEKYLINVERNAFAKSIGVSRDMVYQWVKGIRPISIEKCVSIERVTSSKVTRKDLRPDDWHLIWPELANESQQKEAA
jgi:DNA-binding transcriptional regulator YdaS (Cro superfamily)